MQYKKQCTFCREMKDTTKFHRCEKNPDGLQHRCKPCNNNTKNTNKRVLIVPIEIHHRYCKVCGDLKPLDSFPKNGRGGTRPLCKPCHSEKRRKSYAMRIVLAKSPTEKEAM